MTTPDPNIDLKDLFPTTAKPKPPERIPSDPGRWNQICMVLSIVGMLVCGPVFYRIATVNFQGGIPLNMIVKSLIFLFSLILFAGTVGTRFVFWLAQQFVDLLFDPNSGPPPTPARREDLPEFRKAKAGEAAEAKKDEKPGA